MYLILCLGQNAVHKALDDDNAGVILVVSQTQLMIAVNFGFCAAAVWIVKPSIHRGGVKIRIDVEVARLLGHAVVQPF